MSAEGAKVATPNLSGKRTEKYKGIDRLRIEKVGVLERFLSFFMVTQCLLKGRRNDKCGQRLMRG